MGNGKITKELKGLGLKVNEKEPNGETVSEVIKGIADDYTGGGSGATYTAGNGVEITNENVINADLKVIETSNITGLTTEQCETLNVGDIVVKLTSNQKHTYTVSYKEAGVGMCLTYVDASTSETVSYDYVDNAWVYNSTDITPLNGGGTSLYYINVYGLINGYAGSFLLQVDNNSLETYEDLYNYLYNKGIHEAMILPIYAIDSEQNLYLGVHAELVSSPFGEDEHYIGVLKNTFGNAHIDDDESFSITYLGQE